MNEMNEMKMMSSQVLTQHFQLNEYISCFVSFVSFISFQLYTYNQPLSISLNDDSAPF